MIARPDVSAFQVLRWRTNGDAHVLRHPPRDAAATAPVDMRLVVHLEARVSRSWAVARGGTDRTPGAPRQQARR